MIALLDVNVLIALVDERHSHHRRALDWLTRNVEEGWATCPITQNGCLRILSQPRYSNPMSIMRAIDGLREVVSRYNHRFISDDVSLIEDAVVLRESLTGHRELTDVYLLCLAVRHDFRFVTFDSGVRLATVRGASEGHLVLI